MALAKKKSSSKSRSASSKRASSRQRQQPPLATGKGHFAVCVQNRGYSASLELRKLYRVLDDSFAAQHGMIRVVDESGEDYLYSREYFVLVDLPISIERALAKIA
jgi:hypothetical protein